MRALVLLLALLAAGCGTAQRWQPPTEQQMAAVKEGMSRAEVEKVMGAPPDGGTERRAGETVSAWRILVEGATTDSVYFQVHYRNGLVTRTTRARLYDTSL